MAGMQVYSIAETGSATDAGTSAVRFPDKRGGLVMFQAHPDNTGTVTIVGVTAAGTLGSAGPVLDAGGWSPTFPIQNLQQFGFILATGNDVVNWVVLR